MARIIILLAAAAVPALAAAQRLLYLEAQTVGGYSFASGDVRWYSMHRMDAMQKPSIGFDLVQKLSGEYGDWGAVAVQARLAYDTSRVYNVEPQLYNTYFRLKPGFYDVWLGHSRPAFGLSSTLDNHGTLLQPLSMYGFGYDRDWGAGYYRDLQWGSTALSATLGSGMPFHVEDNYLLSGRASKGDLDRDNLSFGISASYGRTLETMGYHLMAPEPRLMALGGVDASWRRNNLENRAELAAGRLNGASARAAFWRGSLLLAEDRLRLEAQGVFLRAGDIDRYQVLSGLSYAISPSLAARAVLAWGHPYEEWTAAGQVYWYYNL